METVVANVAGRAQRRSSEGREYLVVPVTMLVPGVLSGSRGPLYYPADEIARDPGSWDHIPVTVYHPTRNGAPVSAREPDVLGRQGVGFIRHTHIGDASKTEPLRRPKGRLVAEAWFDVETTSRVDQRILNAIEAGLPIEVSTGLYTDSEAAPPGSNHNGRPYNHIARNYRPDHLAVLPDETGACSLHDGCGLNVNRATNQTSQWQAVDTVEKTGGVPVLVTNCAEAHSPSQNQNLDQDRGWSMVLTNEQRKEIIEGLITNCECWKSEGDSVILATLPDAKLLTLKEQAEKDAAMAAVANAAAHGFQDQKGNAYRVNPETGRWEQKAATSPASQNTSPVPPPPAHTPPAHTPPAPVPTDNAEQRRPKSAEDWYKSAPQEVQNTIRVAQQIEQREKEKLVNELLANVADVDRGAHKERLMSRSVQDLQYDLDLRKKSMPAPDPATQQQPTSNASRRLNQSHRQQQTPPDNDVLGLPQMNWKEISTLGGDDEAASKTARAASEPINNEYQDVNEEEFLSALPPHLRSKYTSALALSEQERRRLINDLTANAADEETERRMVARLQDKSLEELRDLVSLIPKKETPKPNYFGAAGAPVGNTRHNDADADVLPLPSMNWVDVAKQG